MGLPKYVRQPQTFYLSPTKITVLTLTDINKSYGRLKVVRDASLIVPQGEILAIIGPSGAGKTTLLQIAGTLDRPDSGHVLYDQTDITSLSGKRLSEFRNLNIGFIFQFHQLLAEFTARENVALPAFIAGESRNKALRRADELLEILGIGDRASHKPAQLSGGEKQRTAIARALINNPKIIFADEPTGSLDTANRDEILGIIKSMRDRTDTTFVIVTHDPTLAATADRVITMKDGQIMRSEEED